MSTVVRRCHNTVVGTQCMVSSSGNWRKKGIGFAIVKGLSKQFDGVVYLTARSTERGHAAVEELKNIGLHVKFHRLDVTDNTGFEIFKNYIKDTHGGIDILVNNAAIAFKLTNEDADINSSSNTYSAEVEGFYDEAEESSENSNPGDPEVTNPRYLSFDEAARCLSLLGKNDSGLKYSYLMLKASDKLLTDISIIPTFRNLLFVDVSGNLLTLSEIEILTSMTYLLMIKADRNRIESANFRSSMLYLQVLSLNRNKITETKGISHRLLECLELSNNLIKVVDLNPYELENLKVLEIRGNILTTMNGLSFPNLTALYIAENRIERMEGLETLLNLEILHARGNFISSFDVLYETPTICPKLSYLNLRDNKISRISEFRELQGLKKLETLVTSRNPFEKNYTADNSYRIHLVAIFPGLKRINKDPVLEEELDEANKLQQKILPVENISSPDDEVIE